jgi:hypothetical protein
MNLNTSKEDTKTEQVGLFGLRINSVDSIKMTKMLARIKICLSGSLIET